ncbi:MAG: septum formation initiator family protein [Lachnospiraceae bacterium]|nr:septum formation initiator family protein [Lachnospiraceae bacterium]
MTTEERYQLIYGNTARVAEPAQDPKKPERPKRQRKKTPQTKQEQLFDIEWKNKRLYAAVVLIVFLSISYVNLNASTTQLRKEIAVLKTELNTSKIENDDLEASIYSQTNYDVIKQTATQKLGMAKPKADHIIKYGSGNKDYVRQYGTIPD